jgi:hypothetical protein
MQEVQMGEMIERVARASFKAYCDRNKLQFKFDDIHSDELEFAMIHARACIEAMREPTKEMIDACDINITEGEIVGVWGSMIDEALK